MSLLGKFVEDLLKLCILGVVFVDVEGSNKEEADQFLWVVGATSPENQRAVAISIFRERGPMQQATGSTDDVIHILRNQQERFGEVTRLFALRLVVAALLSWQIIDYCFAIAACVSHYYLYVIKPVSQSYQK